MKTDVRAKTTVWLVVRRVSKTHYDVMGIWVDSDAADAESLAVSTCLDDSYFCGPIPVNVALPEKPVAWKGSYSPTRRARQNAARKAAREATTGAPAKAKVKLKPKLA